jgi:ABC-type lipoprotein export system ATPase subunit
VAALLEARRLRRTFGNGRIEALHDASLTLDAGEFVAIEGPSGSGKSTLLHILGTLDQPTSGNVLFRGAPATALGDLDTFRATTIGFVFQHAILLPTLTALENVEVPMFGRVSSPRERRTRARAILDAVGLTPRLDHRPAALSGGERQRVAIARSLVNQPAVVLADEPTGQLDRGTRDELLVLLTDLCGTRGTALLIATHDEAVAARAHRTLQMRHGTIAA